MKTKTLKNKFENFKKAYLELLADEEFEDVVNSRTEVYPFENSFEELGIIEWVESMHEVIDNKWRTIALSINSQDIIIDGDEDLAAMAEYGLEVKYENENVIIKGKYDDVKHWWKECYDNGEFTFDNWVKENEEEI